MSTAIDHWLGNTVEGQINAVVDMACRLFDHDAIGSIHVMLPERPSYDALMRYRTRAAGCGLSLTLMDSELVVRPLLARQADDDALDEAPARRIRSRRRKLGAGRLREHLKAWGAELRRMSEGTR